MGLELCYIIKTELCDEKTALCICTCEKRCTEKPAHTQRLISALAVRSRDRMIYVAGQFASYLVGKPYDRFSREEAQIISYSYLQCILNSIV